MLKRLRILFSASVLLMANELIQTPVFASPAKNEKAAMGRVGEEEKKRKFDQLTERAELGNSQSQALLAESYYYGVRDVAKQNYSLAIEWANRSAMAGNAKALELLGLAYYTGNGVPQNRVKASQNFQKAAEGGSLTGQYNFAKMLIDGDGIPSDIVVGISWLTKASNAGNAYAQYDLGLQYESGKNVKGNQKLATELYRKAAAQGHYLASEKMSAVEKGSGSNIASKNKGFKSPAEFTSPNEWIQYVTRQSLSGGRKGFNKVGLALMGPYGWNGIEMEKGKEELPKVYREKMTYPQYVRSFIYYESDHFNLGPYASKDGQVRAVSDYCSSKLGSMVGEFCETRTGPLFFFKREKVGNILHTLTLIEPTTDFRINPLIFLENMNGLGYVDPVSRQKKRQRVIDLANESSRRERQFQQGQAPDRRKIGAKICKKADGWILVGFVEGKSVDTEKVQIRIANQHAENQPRIQAGGFREQIIWDSPDNWFLCE